MTTKMKRISILAGFTMLVVLLLVGQGLAQTELTPVEELGKFLYFDVNLSDCSLVEEGEVCNPDGQSCASCHDPEFGFVDPDSELPVSEGVIFGRFGGRNSPASAYAMYAPLLYYDVPEGLWIGGQFWDGRATGAVLGDPLADQALGPFLNPVEMANPSKAQVIADVTTSDYADLFEQVWGPGSLNDVEIAYDQVALSIAAFERSGLFGQFSSQYDAYLNACIIGGGDKDDCAKGVGKIAKKVVKKYFSKEEWYGFQLFMGENNNDGILDQGEGAMCSACHIAEWTAVAEYDLPVVVPSWAPPGMVPPMFTDFTFDNLGVPKNEEFPLTGAPVDLGLGPIVGDVDENGKFKVMTLRNIGLTAPYAHNGLFKTLKEITHFYNTRDVPGSLRKGMDWDPPEYPDTVNFDELGNLGLSDADEDALVEFMKTLSDGYAP
jgi:cytochrome c peroxidase